MTTNRAQIAELLKPGVDEIIMNEKVYDPEWPEIFRTRQSHKAVEYDVEMKLTGLASIKQEGAAIAFDDMGERFITQYINRTIGLGTSITMEAIEDNLYKDEFPEQIRHLKRSMMITKDILGASVLNNGFNTAFPIGDGRPLFDLNHPIDTGFVPNTPAIQADLNLSSLQDGIITIGKFRDQAGLLMQVKPMKLIVPIDLSFVATQILKSEFITDSANNDINAVKYLNSIQKSFRVNHYLTDEDAWFITTDNDGFKHFARSGMESDVYADVHTKNVIATVYERYSFGTSNFRCAYGSEGSAT